MPSELASFINVHSSAVVGLYFCTRKVRGSNPPLVNVFFSSISWVPRFKSRQKKSFLQHPSTLMPHPSGALYSPTEQPQGSGERRKAAELALKCKINSKNALLLHRKNEKFIFFKNPSFKIKMLLVGHYTHEWVWKTYLRMLLTFFDNRKTLDEHCAMKAYTKNKQTNPIAYNVYHR